MHWDHQKWEKVKRTAGHSLQTCLGFRAGKMSSTPDAEQLEKHSLFIFIYSLSWCPWLPRGATESSFYCAGG